MQALRLIIPVLLLAFLCSCMPIETNIENLLAAPQLTEEQQNINNALNFYAGDVSIKYPKNGDYRSAYIMYDLDHDGKQEAIVFYNDNSGSNSRVNVLDHVDGEWQLVSSLAGKGAEVDEVKFLSLSSKNQVDIVVGWDIGDNENKTLAIYQYDGKELKMSYFGGYSLIHYTDIDDDGLDDIISINGSVNVAGHELYLIKANSYGAVDETASTTLKGNVSEYLQITKSKLPDGKTALYLDELRGQKLINTEIVSYEKQRQNEYMTTDILKNITYSFMDAGEENESYITIDHINFTSRNAPILSQDINADGVLEVPSMLMLPGYEKAGSKGLSILQWQQFTDDAFKPLIYTFVDSTYRFTFFFPTRWVGRVSIRYDSISNEWIFLEADEDIMISKNQKELARIKVYEESDYRDEFETNRYIFISNQKPFYYYYRLPNIEETADEFLPSKDLIINETEFLDCFHIDL